MSFEYLSNDQVGVDTQYNHQVSKLESAGFGDILNSPTIQKLSGVSFLGILDNVYQITKPSSRLEHTIGVASLALELSEKLKLSEDEKFSFVIAAFLHDVGHAAFSHNSEPFLLETKKVYHTGALSRFFKSEPRILVDLVFKSNNSNIGEKILNHVIALLSGTAEEHLQRLFSSPLNCDKIEGNLRTGLHLGFPGISPKDILPIFEIEDNQVVVDVSALAQIEAFWLHEKELYWNKIYTNEVFASEAMLTRALHQRFSETPEEVMRLTDNEVMEKLLEDSYSSILADRIISGQYLQPLSIINPKLFDTYKDKLRMNRFDQYFRKTIEVEIAKVLKVDKEFVISHFSRRKHFNGGIETLRQLSLFDFTSAEKLHLSRIDEALRRTKISGDFFDIFVSV